MTRTAYRPTTSLDRLCHALGEEVTSFLGRSTIRWIALWKVRKTKDLKLSREDLQDEILDAIHFDFEQRIGVYADDNGERLARYLATGK